MSCKSILTPYYSHRTRERQDPDCYCHLP